MSVQHNRGKIKQNALKALITSNLFRPKKEKRKKAYTRQAKHRLKDNPSD